MGYRKVVQEVMQYLHNYFLIDGALKLGKFKITNGSVELPFLQPGQWFMVEGSVFNDGVYRYQVDEMCDETFHGCIAPMAPDSTFLAVCSEIADWQEKNAEAVAQPFQSESFGGYSYTRATAKNGSAYSWKDAFGMRLNNWRKI